MKRLFSSAVLLATSFGLWSCGGDPTENLREAPNQILADPSVVIIDQGESQTVTVTVIGEAGDPFATSVAVAAAGSGITVVEDTAFLGTTVGQPIGTQRQFVVSATDPVGTSFTLQAEGLSLEVPVIVVPTSVAGTFSNAAPALGEVVTLTAPPGITFGPEASITFPGAQGEPVVTEISADGTVLSFQPAPGTDTTGFVSGVVVPYSPDLPIDTIETTTKITTPAIPNLPAAFSNANPAVNEPVTVTASGFTFLDGTTVIFEADTTIVGDVTDTAYVSSRAADGSSVTFTAPPGASGIPTVSGAALDVLPAIGLTLLATSAVTVDSTVPTLVGTVSPATAPALTVPAVGLRSALFDAPDFTATIDHFYRLDLTEAGDYTITVDWTVGSDIDLILCNDVACSAPDFAAATANKPESATFTREPGTYYVLVEDFGADAAGATVSIVVEHSITEE